MISDLADAVDTLDVPTDGEGLAQVLALRDRLEAKIAAGVCAFDDTDEWDTAEGCVSLGAWLRIRGRMTAGDASRLARTARRLRHLPTLRAAWLDGSLSGGHVATVVANLNDRTVALFRDQEDDLVPVLAQVEVGAAATAMKAWAAQARQGPRRRSRRAGPGPHRARVAHAQRWTARCEPGARGLPRRRGGPAVGDGHQDRRGQPVDAPASPRRVGRGVHPLPRPPERPHRRASPAPPQHHDPVGEPRRGTRAGNLHRRHPHHRRRRPPPRLRRQRPTASSPAATARSSTTDAPPAPSPPRCSWSCASATRAAATPAATGRHT